MYKAEPTVRSLQKKFIIGIIFGVLMTAAILFGLDIVKIVSIINKFKLELVPLIFFLIVLAYLGRLIKWQMFLNTLKVFIQLKDSMLIFFAGLSMTITPGKAGEVYKAFLLKRKFGVELSRSAPTIIAERLSGLIGAIVLCSISIYLSNDKIPYSKSLVTIAICFVVVISVFLKQRFFIYFAVLCLKKLSAFYKKLSPLLSFYKSARHLTSEPLFSRCIIISMFSWGCESAILYLALAGLGVEVPFFQAVLVYTLGSIAGGLSMLPGGVGAAEISMVALLSLIGVENTTAVGATLIVRFMTIWLGVISGIIIVIKNWYSFNLATASNK